MEPMYTRMNWVLCRDPGCFADALVTSIFKAIAMTTSSVTGNRLDRSHRRASSNNWAIGETRTRQRKKTVLSHFYRFLLWLSMVCLVANLVEQGSSILAVTEKNIKLNVRRTIRWRLLVLERWSFGQQKHITFIAVYANLICVLSSQFSWQC